MNECTSAGYMIFELLYKRKSRFGQKRSIKRIKRIEFVLKIAQKPT